MNKTPETIPAPITTYAEHTQPTSKLLSLPAELRLKIYKAALGHRKIHCISVLGHFGYYACADPSACECQSRVFNKSKSVAARPWRDSAYPRPGADGPSIQFLRVCRQVYVEAGHVPYSCNEFAVHGGRSLYHVTLDLPAYRVRQIRSVSLVFDFGGLSVIPGTFQRTWVRTADMPTTDTAWKDTWKLLAERFGGVRWLGVELEAISIVNVLDDGGVKWVDPMLLARALPLERCRVRLRQSSGEPRPRVEELVALEKRIEGMLLDSVGV